LIRRVAVAFVLPLLTGCNVGFGTTPKPVLHSASSITPDRTSLNGKRPFPDNNPWNTPVDAVPVDPLSQTILATIGLDKPLHPDFGTEWQGVPSGIPFVVVPGTQPRVPVKFDYPQESDPGPYPIPPDAPIEGGSESKGDRHVLVIDRDNWKLYELYAAYPLPDGSWKAGSGAVFDLNSNKLRPAGWTSADAAGLPIFPGLTRYEEVVGRKEILHALRFTVRRTRHGYVFPARHRASKLKEVQYPPLGARFRLKQSFDISAYPAEAQVILKALKKYGMILADNGGDMFISGAPDSRWDDGAVNALKRVRTSDFEVIKMGPVSE
jgi:hypothetical protein